MADEREIVQSELEFIGYDEGNGREEIAVPLTTAIERLQKCLASIPEECRDSAQLSIHAYGDYASAYVNVTFGRPETDAEMAERTAREAAWNRQWEEGERRQYEALKAKFGE